MPDASDLDADLALIAEAAREAGHLALEWLERGARRWDKSPNNPVTEADIACNDLLIRKLRTARPGYGWLSEETRDSAADRSQNRVFVVDPLDGTIHSENILNLRFGIGNRICRNIRFVLRRKNSFDDPGTIR